ncbi:MFS general substrate transporter [Aspergillus californicus]
MAVFSQVPSSPEEADANAEQHRSPRYPGEDTSPTQRREIWGWYAYGIAAEVFAVCGVGSFLPLTLEQLAREQGYLLSSRHACVGPDAPVTGNGTTPANEACIVPVMGLEINTASFAMYTFSLAVLVQALTLVSFSALADYESNRKSLLLAFGLVGSVTSMLFMLVAPPVFVLGALLVVVGVTCLGSSFVVLNSFLPILVANDPSIQSPSKNEDYTGGDAFSLRSWSDEEDASNYRTSAESAKTPGTPSPELELSTSISSRGVGLGYGAAILVQILSVLLLFTLSKTAMAKSFPSLPLRCVLLLVGIWWCIFTLVSSRWLRNRPGPPLDGVDPGAGFVQKWRARLGLVGFAWKSLWKTIKVAVRLREVVLFLVAWFLLSDAMATVSGTAILFARTELHLSTTSIGLLSITVITSGMAGAFLWPVVSRRLGLASNHTVLVCLALFEIIPLYGMLAYIPFIRKWGVLGLQQPWEIFPLGVIHGLVSGGLSSYCRSLFGELIPPGSEAAFYALYAATDKGSSFVGPAVVGVLIDATGSVRSGFIFIAVLIVLPMPLVWFVDAERGRRDAVAMVKHAPNEEGEGLLRR